MKKYKNKKQRIREKRIKIKNKKLIKQWAFLKPYNVWTGKTWKDYRYETTWADDLPRGWRKAFGDMMFEEIDKVLKQTNTTIYIEQIKEKYGQLRFYFSGTDEIHDIVEKYSILSENICIKCGKPDVPMLDTGWMSPVCQECFEHNQRINKWAPQGHYTDYVCGDYHMADEMRWRKYSTEGITEHHMDISDTANAIRIKYQERKKNEK